MNGKPGVLSMKCEALRGLMRVFIDTLKGSYYANPTIDQVTVSEDLRQAYPEYYGANICMYRLFVWPCFSWLKRAGIR